MKLLIINGPNLNMLGLREPDIYGKRTYADLVEYIQGVCRQTGIEAEVFQSNHEGAIVDKIQSAYGTADGIVINPAAYTHTSVAILDALKAVNLPAVEVHISDVNSREGGGFCEAKDGRSWLAPSIFPESLTHGAGELIMQSGGNATKLFIL